MLDLDLLPEEYAVCRLPAGSALPAAGVPTGGGLFSVTWTPDEIEAVLGPQRGATFGRVYDVSDLGNFEGRSILHVAGGDIHLPVPNPLHG